MYTHILPNDKTRIKALEKFFYSYINMYPVGTIVAPSKNIEAIGYIFYTDSDVDKFKQIKDLVLYSLNLTTMMKYISLKEFILFVKAIYNNSSAWIDEFIDGKFIHIDLIVVDEKHRNKGLAKSIIKEVFKKADKENLPTTLETQNPMNVKIYEKLGFEVVKKQNYESLTQYCMIRQPNS
ncbi:MAG: GNAT family N-acetyltransferase [Peptostreptococcaceae bacterium]